MMEEAGFFSPMSKLLVCVEEDEDAGDKRDSSLKKYCLMLGLL